MIKPPPVEEPWRLDPSGRLMSPAWVLWLQELVSIDRSGVLQSGSTNITQLVVGGVVVTTETESSLINDVTSTSTFTNDEINIGLINEQITTSTTQTDVDSVYTELQLINPVNTSSYINNDSEMLTWLSF